MSRVDVLGVGFDRLDLGASARALADRLERGERTIAITANPEFVMHSRRDADLRAIAAAADLVLADGTGILLASRILGDPLPGRAPGRKLVDLLVADAEATGAPLFLLGAAPGVAERAAERIRARHPRVRIAGTYAGDASPAGDDETVARVAAAAPRVLLVAYGMPAQERWIARNVARLPSVRVAIGVGGVLDQLAGVARVPPAPVHAVGLEWLWRLLRDPRRWRRQRVLPAFVFYVLLERLAR
ncbi:MAG: WecB/TagA/CpsF family glycosyltransferase [Chloroflexota bacterium]|nr:WecB/TagA/CpsF family glycosyltransferase [Chloroflexota bacterium]